MFEALFRGILVAMAFASTTTADAIEPAALRTYTAADEQNSARKVAFWFAWIMVFIRFSLLQQFGNYFVHTNLYLLYLFGVPALFGVFICGGIQRSFDRRAAYWMTAYACWLVVVIPFSSWRGDSFHSVFGYLRADFPMLFIVAGLTLTWKECERMLYAVALGGAVELLWGRIFEKVVGDRMSLGISSLGNANDYAAHMILCLGFVFWLASHPKRNIFMRVFASLAIVYGILLIIRTASRGALVSLCCVFILFLFRATLAQRLALLVSAPVILAIVLASVPKTTLQRLATFSKADESATAEAVLSGLNRQYLFRKSLEYTFTHPLFGVGPGQFATYEGSHNKIIGEHGSWHNTHNTFTQVSSETGILGAILFIGAIASIISAFRRINAAARKRPECADIAVASFSALAGTVGFVVAVTFLSFAYFFYFPFLAGLAVAMSRAADQEFQNRQTPAPVMVQLLPARRRIVRSAAEVAATV